MGGTIPDDDWIQLGIWTTCPNCSGRMNMTELSLFGMCRDCENAALGA